MTTDTAVVTPKMEQWLKALRSGEYEQAFGALYTGEGFCCLGIADKVCFNAEFSVIPHGVWRDDLNAEGTLPTPRAQELGLDNTLYTEELSPIYNYVQERLGYTKRIGTSQPSDGQSTITGMNEEHQIFTVSVTHTRQDILANLNDHKLTFTEIADFIEYMGWHKNT